MLSRTFQAVVWLLLGLWLAPACGASDDRGTDRSLIVERLVHHYTVEADGSYRLAVEEVRTVVAPPASALASRRIIAVDPARDRVETVDAWTQKPGGQRVAADAREGTITFAQVAAGDRLVLRYVLWRRAARLAGQFEDLVLPAPLRHRDFQVIYDLPAGRALHADAVGFAPVADASPPGRQRYRWRYVDGANPRSEPAGVSQVDEGRRLAVSTFEDYRALAAALRAALGPTGNDSTLALVNDANTYTVPEAPTLAVFNHLVVFVPKWDVYLDPASGGPLPRSLLGKPVLRLDTGQFAMTPVLLPGPPDRASVADALVALAQERNRTWICPAIDTQEEVMLPAAHGASIRPVSIVAGGLYYTAAATRDGAGVVVKRRLSFRHGTPTCTPAEYRAMRPALERIRRNLLGRAA